MVAAQGHSPNQIVGEGGPGIDASGYFQTGMTGGFEQATPEGEPTSAVGGGDFLQHNVVENMQHAGRGFRPLEVATEPEQGLGGTGARDYGLGAEGNVGLKIGEGTCRFGIPGEHNGVGRVADPIRRTGFRTDGDDTAGHNGRAMGTLDNERGETERGAAVAGVSK